MPISGRRDYIGEALRQALLELGGGFAGRIQREGEMDYQTGLLNQLQSQKDPRAPMPASQMSGNLEQDAFQQRPMLDERNLNLLSRLNPQTLQLLQMMQPKYGVTEGASGQMMETRITPQGASVRQLSPPVFTPQYGWTTGDTPQTFTIPGTDDTRVWEYEVDQNGRQTGKKRLATGGSPSMGSMFSVGRTHQLVPTNQGFRLFNKETKQFEDIKGAEGLGKPPSENMVTAQSQLSTLKSSFDRVKELYKPEYVGPAAGRIGGIREATVGLPEEQAAFYSDLADIQNTLIYLKSGKQINENEYQRLLKQLPDKNQPESVFNARIGEFERVLNEIETSRLSNLGGYGIRPPQAKPQVQTGRIRVKRISDGKTGTIEAKDFDAAKYQKIQ